MIFESTYLNISKHIKTLTRYVVRTPTEIIYEMVRLLFLLKLCEGNNKPLRICLAKTKFTFNTCCSKAP